MSDIDSMLRDFEWAILNREDGERNQGLMGRAARAQQRIVDEMARLTRDRDLWKERHDRERAAHAKNLTEQQKVEAERNRLRAENADLHRRFREMCDIAFTSSPTDVGHDETDVSSTDSIAEQP